MKALFIMNGIGSENGVPGISGGDVRWIEIAKKWDKLGIEIDVLTPLAGKELCNRLGLRATYHIFDVPNEYSKINYFKRALRSKDIPETLNGFNGIICATTEHWYDVVPASQIKKFNGNNKLAVVAHWVAPMKRKGTSAINSLLFFINQRVGYYYARKFADIILAVSESTMNDLKKVKIPKEKIQIVEAGVDYNAITTIVSQVNIKRYDSVFMKRFDGTKGIYDIIEIWSKVVKIKKDAKLGLIGFGTKNVMDKLHSMIGEYGLENNITIIGPIYDIDKKFETLAQSKLFVLPTYEENWAIVIGEAMATGIPVICYDIKEIRPIWEDNVIWVEKGDKEKFAKEIIKLLDNDEKCSELSKKAQNFVKKYEWGNIAKKELQYILE